MDMIIGKCKFPKYFSSLLSVAYIVGTHLNYLRQFQCGPTTYVFSINEFFTISFFKQIQPLSFIQRKEHVEMNNFSCSLSCTWMTILVCL